MTLLTNEGEKLVLKKKKKKKRYCQQVYMIATYSKANENTRSKKINQLRI